MTTVVHDQVLRGVRLPVLPLNRAATAYREWRERQARRADLARLRPLGRRLMRDIGVDPERVEAALGGWDDLLPNGYLVRRR